MSVFKDFFLDASKLLNNVDESIFAAGDLTLFRSVLLLFSKGIVALGGIYCVIGILSVARGYKDHAGADMNTGISQIVSGGVFILAAVILKMIDL